jgi:hypothetical protein
MLSNPNRMIARRLAKPVRCNANNSCNLHPKRPTFTIFQDLEFNGLVPRFFFNSGLPLMTSKNLQRSTELAFFAVLVWGTVANAELIIAPVFDSREGDAPIATVGISAHTPAPNVAAH